jgi:peptidoglycan/xylan/chitin deacetylase (PgdA/CDA1 family)
MRTQVAITIDTEFSIGGAFGDPERRTPLGIENVTCPVDGEEQGLGFLLDTFARHGTHATFFVEALQTSWFGNAPMESVVERILSANQDVQLHLHPCWTAFRDPDWKSRLGAGDPNDNCDGLPIAELKVLIEEGLAALERMGAPQPVALRTGNLRADRNVYRAMAECGLPLASNIGLGLNRPTDSALRLRGGRHWIEGILEVPVLSYIQPALGRTQADRLFTTTATSTQETEALLWAAREAGVQTVVLLTHPFEFIKGDRLDPGSQRANRINQRRLERLCAFLAEHHDQFESVSFGEAAPGWLAAPEEPEPRLYAPLLPTLGRMVQNKANDLIPAL